MPPPPSGARSHSLVVARLVRFDPNILRLVPSDTLKGVREDIVNHVNAADMWNLRPSIYKRVSPNEFMPWSILFTCTFFLCYYASGEIGKLYGWDNQLVSLFGGLI